MKTSHQLWYIQHADSITGPFPPQVVSQYLLLGRIRLDDQVSPDKVNWLPLGDIPELLPKELQLEVDESNPEARMWHEERIKAARRWAEERFGPDNGGVEHRKTGHSYEDMAFRQHHAEVEESLKKKPPRFVGVIVGLVIFALAVAAALVFYQPVNPVKVGLVSPVADCKQAAAPRINWSGCEKQGAWLSEADLSGANLGQIHFNSAQLSKSNLSHVDLSGADLSYANLSGANLSGADLRNADLNYADLGGANLDSTIWIDGRICAHGSVGQCR